MASQCKDFFFIFFFTSFDVENYQKSTIIDTGLENRDFMNCPLVDFFFSLHIFF